MRLHAALCSTGPVLLVAMQDPLGSTGLPLVCIDIGHGCTDDICLRGCLRGWGSQGWAFCKRVFPSGSTGFRLLCTNAQGIATVLIVAYVTLNIAVYPLHRVVHWLRVQVFSNAWGIKNSGRLGANRRNECPLYAG